jgi:hypothetical protein
VFNLRCEKAGEMSDAGMECISTGLAVTLTIKAPRRLRPRRPEAMAIETGERRQIRSKRRMESMLTLEKKVATLDDARFLLLRGVVTAKKRLAVDLMVWRYGK